MENRERDREKKEKQNKIQSVLDGSRSPIFTSTLPHPPPTGGDTLVISLYTFPLVNKKSSLEIGRQGETRGSTRPSSNRCAVPARTDARVTRDCCWTGHCWSGCRTK